MRFKGKKWASPLFIVSLAVAGLFGASAGLLNKQNTETTTSQKAEASDNTNLYSDKIYVELQNTYGLTNSKGVYLHFWGDGVDTIDIKGRTYDGSGGTTGYTWYFIYDSAYRGKKCQFWVDWTGVGTNDWAKNNCDVPDNTSAYRWIYVWKENLWMQNNTRDFYRTISVDNGTTTCDVTGDFMGIQNEYNKTDIVFTVTNPSSDGKVAALGQWNDSSCSGNPHTTHVLTGNKKTLTEGTYKFTSTQYFKPVLYNTLQYSLNNGSTWVDLDCDNPTASTRVYSASSVSMTADSQIKFRFNGSEVNPTLSYGSNFYTSGGKRYVKETGTGDISITYSSSAYSGTFGALATKTSGHYVLNYTTGDLYSTTSKGDSKYGTAITYLYDSEVIRFMHSDGSNNSYYSIKEVNTYSTSGVYSLSGGDVTIIGSDYYYLEIQPTGTGNDKLYIESYGVTITYNLNGHGDSFTSREERNQTFSAPSDPSLTGYTFGGWYKEAECTNKWNFASDTTSTDKTLYAKWTLNTYTVTITVNNASKGRVDVTSIVSVPYGTSVTTSDNTMTINGTTVTATAKTCPTEGYIFAFDEWVAPATITGDITITANFKQVSGQAAARDYCEDFNKKIGAICKASGPRDLTALKNEWDAQAATYRALATYIKYWVKTGSTDNPDIVNMRAKYRSVFDKYGSVLQDDFLYGTTPSASAVRNTSPFSLFNGGDNNPTTIVIIVASSVSLLSITALSILLVKKRKRKED